jgi:hypothetical protein
MPESTISPSQGLRIWLLLDKKIITSFRQVFLYLFTIPNSDIVYSVIVIANNLLYISIPVDMKIKKYAETETLRTFSVIF